MYDIQPERQDMTGKANTAKATFTGRLRRRKARKSTSFNRQLAQAVICHTVCD